MDKNNIKTSTIPVSLTEHLSALLDDEAGSFEQRRVLDELKSDDELRQQLSSYALIGEVMRSSEATLTVGSMFLSGIHEQIESDDEYNQVQLEHSANDGGESDITIGKKRTASWFRPIGGFALAASVVAVAVVGFQNYQSNSSTGMNTGLMITSLDNNLSKEKMATATVVSADQMMPKTLVVASNKANTATTSSSQYQQADVYERQLLKSYVDSHMEHASSVRFIAFTN